MNEVDKLLTPEAVAEVFLVQPTTVREWLRTGQMEGVKLNGRWRIPHSKMVEYANKQFGDNSKEQAV